MKHEDEEKQADDEWEFGPERELAVEILDEFEEMLDSKGITIPSSDRQGAPDEARIFGSEYYALEDAVVEILKRHCRLEHKDTILEALNDYRRWFEEDDENDLETVKEIDAAIREVEACKEKDGGEAKSLS
jgi:hypothetical protein